MRNNLVQQVDDSITTISELQRVLHDRKGGIKSWWGGCQFWIGVKGERVMNEWVGARVRSESNLLKFKFTVTR